MSGRQRVFRAAALALGLGAVLACTGGRAPDPEPDPGRVPAHPIVVVSIDGLRPDAIERYPARTLRRLAHEGATSLEAQTILPSRTLPSHTSMLTGVEPETHGITWNEERLDAHGYVEVPTIFDLASERGLRTAAFVTKAKFNHLMRPGSLDRHEGPRSNLEFWLATRIIPAAIDYMEQHRPDLLFVHLSEPDLAGHAIGWMSVVYGWAVRRADGALGTLIEAADGAYGSGRYTLIVTADHGGHGRDHGSDDPRDTTIPWIAWGRGVEATSELSGLIRTMDTAATALWLLGVPIPDSWSGRPVTAAFETGVPVSP